MKQQKPADKVWRDESGQDIPVNRLRRSEKLREQMAFKIANNASKLSKLLAEQKDLMKEATQAVVLAIIEENDGKKRDTKGNVTWYNFDGTIKVEANIQDRIEFDTTLLDQCKGKLDQLLNENLTSKDVFIKDIVMSAFETSRGSLDTKKVLSLKKHSSRIKHPLYQEAMDLLDKSIRRPDSRTYYRVWRKDENGQYQNIDLNFSSI